MPLDINQIKSFQTGSIKVTTSTITPIPGINSVTGSTSLSKTVESIARLTSKTNEISSFLGDLNIDGGNKPFNLTTFAKNLVTKQSEQPQSTTSQATDSTPLTNKLKQQQSQIVSSITQNYIQSGRLLNILEKNINKVLAQSNVNYVSIENGKIVAQPIQSKEVEQAIQNIQQIINTYVNAVDKYARRVYNTDPIVTLDDFKKNISLNKLVDITYKVISIVLLILEIKIKLRKANDAAVAANALAQVPVPNIALATEYTQRATQFTATELKQMEDLNGSFQIVSGSREKINFYGKKYQQSKNKLLDLQGTINNYQQQVLNNSLQSLNNQITGSYNQITGSIETKINNTTGSI